MSCYGDCTVFDELAEAKKQLAAKDAEIASQKHCYNDLHDHMEKQCVKLAQRDALLDRALEALTFYGFDAIHNPNAHSKSEQYWNDKGIWDHGERARKALAEIRSARGTG